MDLQGRWRRPRGSGTPADQWRRWRAQPPPGRSMQRRLASPRGSIARRCCLLHHRRPCRLLARGGRCQSSACTRGVLSRGLLRERALALDWVRLVRRAMIEDNMWRIWACGCGMRIAWEHRCSLSRYQRCGIGCILCFVGFPFHPSLERLPGQSRRLLDRFPEQLARFCYSARVGYPSARRVQGFRVKDYRCKLLGR